MKTQKTMNRREFIRQSSLLSTALCAPGISGLSFAQGQQESNGVVVVIFQRGGSDGLSTLVPSSSEDAAFYQHQRPTISQNPTIEMPGETRFRLNKAMEPLLSIWDAQDQGSLSFFPATHTGIGKNVGSRSHFKGQEIMEYGGGGNNVNAIKNNLINNSVELGLAARTLEDLKRDINLYSFSSNKFVLGNRGAVISNNPRNVIDFDEKIMQRNNKIRQRIAKDGEAHDIILNAAINAQEKVSLLNSVNYLVARGGYDRNGFGAQLRNTSCLIQSPHMSSLEMVFLDHAGHYDTHINQVDRQNAMLNDLARNLRVFHDDLLGFHKPIEVVVITEFGRTIDENKSEGTDHGQGSCAMVMGTGNSGQNKKTSGIVGNWTGLEDMTTYQSSRLYLDAITDYRDILSEIMLSTLKRSNAYDIFAKADSSYIQQQLGYLNYS